MPNLKFNKMSLERVRQTLWNFARGEAKNPAQIDYLVKMNLPPMLGRRNAILQQAMQRLQGDLFAFPDIERQEILNSCAAMIDESITATQAILMTLSNADTAAREQQIHAFLMMLRDLVEAAAKLSNFGDALAKDNRAMIKFLGKDFDRALNKNQSTFDTCELSLVTCVQQFIMNAEPSILRYREYTVSSFNQHNAKRYQNAFDRTSAIYFNIGKPTAPEGW